MGAMKCSSSSSRSRNMPDTSPACQRAGGHAGVPQPQQSSSLVSRITGAYCCHRKEPTLTVGLIPCSLRHACSGSYGLF